MAILTIDQLFAGKMPPQKLFKVGATMEAAAVLHSFFYTSGIPGAAAAPSSGGLNGAALTSYAGQIPWINPSGGKETRFASLVARATVAGTLHLYDRLWHNASIGITTTGAQAITSPTWPARDMDGATAGRGVFIALEASAAIGGGAVSNTTLNYTNSAGTSGRTGTMASWPATAAAGTFVPFQLAAGDEGVQSVQGVTLGTTYTSGTVHLVAYREIATIPCLLANVASSYNSDDLFQKLFDNSVLFPVWCPTATTATTLDAQLVFSQN